MNLASPSLARLAYAFAALARRKEKAFALGIGLALTVALLAAVLFLSDALRTEAERASLATPDLVVQELVGGRPGLVSAADADRIRGLPSAGKITPRVWGYVFLPAIQGNATVVGVAEDAPPLGEIPQGALASGRALGPPSASPHEMLMGAGLAHELGLEVGDALALPAPQVRPLTLVGTFSSSLDLFTADVVLCREADARALLGIPDGQATDLAVQVLNPAEAHVLGRTIAARLAASSPRIVERSLLGRVYALSYGRRSGLILAAAVPALFALLVLAWDRASGLAADERREIAILKAVGWSTGDVLWSKMYEALLVASVGTAVGLALAYAWVFLLGAPGLRAALVGWSTVYPTHPLTPAVDVTQLVAVSLAVVGPFVGLSIVPAWRAATIDPAHAMRT